MSATREEILARVRAALRDVPAEIPVPRAYRQAGQRETPRPELLSLFEERLRDYGAKVRRVPAAEAAGALREVLRAHSARRICRPPGLAVELGEVEVAIDDPPLSPRELDGLDGVLTGCALAVAETGTIVLDAGERSGRRAITLVPDLHVCLVEAAQVVASIPDAVAALAGAAHEGRPLTWISGPSATSDIGFERVEGVHGPRRLEVVLLTQDR